MLSHYVPGVDCSTPDTLWGPVVRHDGYRTDDRAERWRGASQRQVAQQDAARAVDVAIGVVAAAGTAKHLAGAERGVDFATLAAGFGGVRFVADDHVAVRVGTGLTQQALVKPGVRPGARYLPCLTYSEPFAGALLALLYWTDSRLFLLAFCESASIERDKR